MEKTKGFEAMEISNKRLRQILSELQFYVQRSELVAARSEMSTVMRMFYSRRKQGQIENIKLLRKFLLRSQKQRKLKALPPYKITPASLNERKQLKSKSNG
jgi:hypothetical protein